MHELFVLIPSWLDLSMETTIDHTQKTFASRHKKAGLESALAFQLLCFESLYRLGLDDVQVAQVTAVTILLHKRFGHITLVPITEKRVAAWKRRNGSSLGPKWFRIKKDFYWGFDSIDDFFREWMALHLPRSDEGVGRMFWHGDPNWPLIFLGGELTSLDKLVETLRVLFAQHCFRMPVTGIWDSECRMVCKSFQERFPEKLIPWKHGLLDAMTYTVLAILWRKRSGLED